MKKIQKKSSRLAYDNAPYLQVREDEVIFPTGKVGTYSVVIRADFVMIVPIDDEGNTYIVKQHRYPVDASPIEFAAGRIDPGEDMIAAAHRELKEELGLVAKKMTLVGSGWVSTGGNNNAGHFFLAEEISDLGSQELDETELIDILKVPYDAIDDMLSAEKVNDQHVIVAKYFVDRFLKQLK